MAGSRGEHTGSRNNSLSKALGYCVIVGAAGAKLPQILQILRAGNAAGLSVLMPIMEVLGCAWLNCFACIACVVGAVPVSSVSGNDYPARWQIPRHFAITWLNDTRSVHTAKII